SEEPVGLEMDSFRAIQIESTRELITWRIAMLGLTCCSPGGCPAKFQRRCARRRAASPMDTTLIFGRCIPAADLCLTRWKKDSSSAHRRWEHRVRFFPYLEICLPLRLCLFCAS